jgi:hypothetical protein
MPARPRAPALALATLGAVLLAIVRRAGHRRARALAAVTRAAAAEPPGRPLPHGLADLSIAPARPGLERALTIERLAGQADAGARELGDLIGAQHPPVVEEQGLAPGVDALAAWLEAVHGLRCEPTVEVAGGLEAQFETAVYRTAESLLTAAVQGGMTWARVHVTGQPARVVVEVVAGPGHDQVALDTLTVTLEPGSAGDPVEAG